jgi:dihydroxy-acid dehydratase
VDGDADIVSCGNPSGGTFGLSICDGSPEAEEGGAIALVEAGDRIAIDIPARTIKLLVSDETLAERRTAMQAKGKDAWKPAAPRKRNVTTALRAYAAFATSAARGAVREVP